MPPYRKAVSKKQQKLFGIAEHHPELLHKENRGVLNMEAADIHSRAATKSKGLPERKRAGFPSGKKRS